MHPLCRLESIRDHLRGREQSPCLAMRSLRGRHRPVIVLNRQRRRLPHPRRTRTPIYGSDRWKKNRPDGLSTDRHVWFVWFLWFVLFICLIWPTDWFLSPKDISQTSQINLCSLRWRTHSRVVSRIDGSNVLFFAFRSSYL